VNGNHVLAPDPEIGYKSISIPGTSADAGTNQNSDPPEFECKYERSLL
jgi:hypothetical protein